MRTLVVRAIVAGLVLPAVAVIVATRGQLGRAKESAATQTAVSDQDL